jgi:hypothetical protein
MELLLTLLLPPFFAELLRDDFCFVVLVATAFLDVVFFLDCVSAREVLRHKQRAKNI